jgi:hypothetical protein
MALLNPAAALILGFFGLVLLGAVRTLFRR